MIKEKKIAFRCACIILVVSFSTIRSSEHETSIDELFTTQRNHLLRLKTMDIIFSQDIKAADHLRNIGETDFFGPPYTTHKFQMEGEKFRVETDGIIYAFDFDNYQVYAKDIMDLYIPKHSIGTMEKANIPYRNTYKWIFLDSKEYSFSGYQDKSKWDDLKHRVKSVISSSFRNLDCVVMEFDYPESNRYTRIHFAKNLEFFPVKAEVFRNGKRVVEHVVNKTETVETERGNIVVPLETVERQWGYETGKLQFTISHSVDREHFSINEDIPDEVFTVPLHMVRSYNNMVNPDASFDVDRVIDASLDGIGALSPSVENHPNQQITEGSDPNIVKSSNDDIYKEPTGRITDVLANDDGEKRLVATISGIVVFILFVVAGVIFVRLRKHEEKST
jgi:hypothetical protein